MVTATTLVSMGEGISTGLSFMSSQSNPMSDSSSSPKVWSDPGSGLSSSIGVLLIVCWF